MEALYQAPGQSVRDFALQLKDTLGAFLSVGEGEAESNPEQRAVLATNREAQALEVFVDGLHDKLRDWAKARNFNTLKEAVDFAVSEEHNIKPKVKGK